MLHPAFLGLDPLFWSQPLLSVDDILHRLVPSQEWRELYLYENHAFKTVEISGLIVAMDRKTSFIQYMVDDGTGTIPVTLWENTPAPTVAIGDLVQIRGKINEYREQRQLNAYQMELVQDPNLEILHWARLLHLKQNYYSKAYCLPGSIQKRSKELQHALQSSETKSEEEPTDWSKLDDISEQETTESTFKMVLLQRVQREKQVLFSDLQSIEEFREFARRVLQLQNEDPADLDRHRVLSLFRRALSSLVLDGLVYLADPNEDLYECITHSHNLGGDLLEILREGTVRLLQRQQQETLTLGEDTTTETESTPVKIDGTLAPLRVPRSEQGEQHNNNNNNATPRNLIPMGLKEDYLVARVQAIPKYQHVKRTMILQSLSRLMADSLVFESGYHQYRWME